MKKPLLRALLLVLIGVGLIACNRAETYQVPEQTDDGWQTTSLDQVGLDQEKLDEAVARIGDGTYENVHAMLIVKDGKLVFERYFTGYTWNYDDEQFRGERIAFDADTTHNLASVTKSFTSALIGIAIDQGFISGVDEKVFAFFPSTPT